MKLSLSTLRSSRRNSCCMGSHISPSVLLYSTMSPFHCRDREETQTIVSNPDPHATVAHLYLSRLSLAAKPGHPINETFQALQQRLRRCVATPRTLSEEAEEVEESVRTSWNRSPESALTGLEGLSLVKKSDGYHGEKYALPESTASLCDGWVNFSAISAYSEDGETSSATMSIEEEVTKCFESLTG